MPVGNYEAGNVSYGIPYLPGTVAGLRAGIHNDTNALKLPPYLHPAPPPTPSPHLICGFAPYTLRHPTSALPLHVPLSQYSATSTSTSTSSIPPICTAADQ